MADISGYLEAIDNAIKGVDVRDSIHDAIEAINVENETLHTQIAEEVIETMDDTIAEYMQDITLLFKYDPKSYSDNYVHLDETMSYSDIFNTEQIGLEWNEENVTTSIYYGYLKCIAKQYATTNTNNIGYLYFYNTHSHKLIEVIITVDGGNMFQFNEIDIGSSSGGSGDGTVDNFTLIFTYDTDSHISVDKSSNDAEKYMNQKYGEYNWTWNDFWAEADIVLVDYYTHGQQTYITPLDHICSESTNNEVTLWFVHEEDSWGSYRIDSDMVKHMVSFIWDRENWNITDIQDTIHDELYNSLTAGDGISIRNGVISVSYDNGDTEAY